MVKEMVIFEGRGGVCCSLLSPGTNWAVILGAQTLEVLRQSAP